MILTNKYRSASFIMHKKERTIKMTKNDFTVTRKPSINIAEYLRKHPTWNCVFELDKEHDGFGWIVHRTPRMIKSVDDIAVKNAMSQINPFAKIENLKLFPAKIQKMPPKKE